MAVNIGPKIGIDGEREYRNQLQNIIQQTKTLGSEMKALSQQFDKNGNSMMSNKQKTEMLNRAIETQKEKLRAQERMLDEATKKYGEADTRTLKWKQTVAETEAELGRLQNELRQIPNSLQVVGQKMQAVGDKMQSVGKSMTMYLTLPIVGLGTAAVKTAADFEAGMSKVKAISGASASEMDALTEKAKEMGETTIFSATESAEALQYMAMAGWKTEDMLNGLEGIMNLAAASGADLATTSDIVTDALTAFGKSAEESGHLADVMAAAASNANTNVEMMGETFKYAAPIAGTLGVSMEDMAVATGLMANAGVKATNAGTALRAGLTRLAAPPKAAAAALNKYGITISDTEGNMLSLREIMENLRGALGDLSTTEQTAALNAIFGKNALSGWAAVLNATEADFNKLAVAIDGSSGSAKSMADTMKDNLKGQLTLLKSQLESVGIEFGTAIMPYVKQFVKGLGDVVTWFKKLSPETKNLIVGIGGLLAVAGPLLTIGGKMVSVGGKIVENVGSMIKSLPNMIAALTGQTAATEAATGAQVGLNAAMIAMPLTAIIGGIAAAVIAVVEFNRSVYESTRTVTGLSEIMDRATDNAEKMTSSMNSYKDTMLSSRNSMQATAVEAEHAAKTLQDIAESGDSSELALAKMSVAVQELNNLFPDMGLELDRSTGKLNKSQTEIDNYIKEAKKMSVVEQTTNMVSASIDEMATASENAAAAQADLDAMLAKNDTLEKQQKSFSDLQTQYDQGRISLDEYRMAVERLVGPVEWAAYTNFELGGHLYNAGEYAWNLEKQVNELSGAIENQRTVVESANQEYETASTAAETLQQSLDTLKASEEAEAEAQGKIVEATTAVIKAEGEAMTAWDQLDIVQQRTVLNAVEAMTTLQTNVESALSSQMNMFEAFDQKAAVSTDTLLNNMRSQIEGVKNWESDLKELAEKGIDQDLLQKLSAMGPEGAGYVAGFKNMTAAELKEANALWKEGLDIQGFGNDEAQELQNAVGAMSAGGKLAFTQLGKDLGLDASNAGKDVGKGLINGLQNLQKEVTDAADDVGEDTIEAINKALGTHSPSKKTLQSGKDTDQGLANGLTQGKGVIITAINGITTLVDNNLIGKLRQKKATLQTVGTELCTALSVGINLGRNNVSTAITGVSATIQNATSTLKGQEQAWKSIGTALCAGLAAGILAGQSQVMAAVVKVTTEAIQRAHAAMAMAGGEETTATAPQSSGAAAAQASRSMSISNDFGGTVVNVYGGDGQDANDIADAVVNRINDNYERVQRVWARANTI